MVGWVYHHHTLWSCIIMVMMHHRDHASWACMIYCRDHGSSCIMHVMSYCMSCHVILHVMSLHVVSCHVACHYQSCHWMSCHCISCHYMSQFITRSVILYLSDQFKRFRQYQSMIDLSLFWWFSFVWFFYAKPPTTFE